MAKQKKQKQKKQEQNKQNKQNKPIVSRSDWSTKRWVLMGKVGVDSGMLMVGDPCYFTDNWVDEDYKNICDRKGMFKQIKGDSKNSKRIYAPDYLKAVVFESGLGDGVYEVWGLIENLADWGERVVEMRIKLI